MRLLILTQAVDLDDPVLGFFHRWIEEVAPRCEHVHVICLKEGRHALPKNVSVHSLGKEGGRSRAKYISRFYRYIWRYKSEYDSVFVHMNSEYVALGGLLWKLWGKRVVLWRNHKMGGLLAVVGARSVNVVCYTSPSAFVAKFSNSVRMPIGIDTKFFSPSGNAPKTDSVLFLGRLDAVKRVEIFIRALDTLHEQNTRFSADIVGDPTDPKSDYAHDMRNLAAPLCLEGVLAMHAAVTNEAARDLFRSNAIYCNLTPSGSFDKTIGEAMACGCVVVACNNALKDVLPEKLIPHDNTPEGAALALRCALELPEEERRALISRSREFVVGEHSLSLLVTRLTGILSGTNLA